MRKILLIFIGWLSLFHSAIAQDSVNIKEDSLKTLYNGKYFKSEASIGFASVRDRGNSALFYRGLVTSTAASLYKVSPSKEFEIGFNITRGFLSTEKDFKAYGQTFTSLSFQAYKLWNILAPDSRWALKVGPGIESQLNSRVNPELFNAYSTLENFTALNAHAKAEINFTRPAKSGKFLSLFKYKRHERKYKLSYHFTGSVLPFSYRPGYAYVGNIVVNSADPYGDHRFFIGGYQFSSEISLTRYLWNGNAIQLSYQWDLSASSPAESRYEMAQHSLKLVWMFNFKK